MSENTEFTRKYKGQGYTVLARPNSCFFCKHLTDIFYDYNGPYLYLCEKHPQIILASGETLIEDEDYIQKGMLGECEDFMEEEI